MRVISVKKLCDFWEQNGHEDAEGPLKAWLTTKALRPMIGTRSRVHEVLSGKRRLTLRMIRKLHQGLGIPLESLLSEAG